MYSAAFIFEPGTYDERFHALDALIEQAARETPGFLGAETWRSDDGARRNATYYWETEDALRAFSANANHLEAKRMYRAWYRGFHIVIGQVIRSYGDGAFDHITPNQRAAALTGAPDAARRPLSSADSLPSNGEQR